MTIATASGKGGTGTACGICVTVCRFDAVEPLGKRYTVIGQNREGCDVCVHQCPESATTSVERQAGMCFESSTRYGPLAHAHLFAGAENSPAGTAVEHAWRSLERYMKPEQKPAL